MSFLKTALMIGAVSLAAAGAARATPLEVTLQSGGQTLNLFGNNPLQYSQTIGNFTASGTGTVFTDPTVIDLAGITASSSGSGTLVITLSANNLTGPAGTNWLTSFTGHSLQGFGTSLSLSTYIDSTNTLEGTKTLLGTFSTTSSLGDGGINLSNIANIVAPLGEYALTEILTITTNGRASVSTDTSATDVPEPSTLLLLGTALFGISVLRRRSRV
jgi:hypothetical protein